MTSDLDSGERAGGLSSKGVCITPLSIFDKPEIIIIIIMKGALSTRTTCL